MDIVMVVVFAGIAIMALYMLRKKTSSGGTGGGYTGGGDDNGKPGESDSDVEHR